MIAVGFLMSQYFAQVVLVHGWSLIKGSGSNV